MKISIVIPVINEAMLIEQAINRAWESGGDEVIVVDGGSSDATLQIAAKLDCVIVESAAGRGIQLNAGRHAANADVLLFLHADGWLAPGACEQIRNSNQIDRKPWGGFKQRINSTKLRFRMLERGNEARSRFQGLVYGDQAMFVAVEAFDRVGGFPDFPVMEDFEISRKLCNQSWPQLLPGPVHVDARRWLRNGIVRQTLRNWSLVAAYRSGVSPQELALRYPRHDQQSD